MVVVVVEERLRRTLDVSAGVGIGAVMKIADVVVENVGNPTEMLLLRQLTDKDECCSFNVLFRKDESFPKPKNLWTSLIFSQIHIKI